MTNNLEKETLKYIQSNALREHLIKINYEPSPMEMVYLIRRNEDLTLWQKYSALRSLETEGELKEQVEDFIISTDKQVKMLEMSEDDRIFSYICEFESDPDEFGCKISTGTSNPLKSMVDCIKYISDTHFVSGMAYIKKFYLDGDFERINVDYKVTHKNLEAMKVFDTRLFLMDIKDLDLPHPFKNGDIIKNIQHNDVSPYYVITDIKNGVILGFNDDSTTYEKRTTDFSYYDYADASQLEGTTRLLISVSKLIKGESNMTQFLNDYEMIKKEQELEYVKYRKKHFVDESEDITGWPI